MSPCVMKREAARGCPCLDDTVPATPLSSWGHMCVSLVPVGSQPATVIPGRIAKQDFPNESGQESQPTSRRMLGMFCQPRVNNHPLLGWWQGLGERQRGCFPSVRSLREEKADKEVANNKKWFFPCNNSADSLSLEWRYRVKKYLLFFS